MDLVTNADEAVDNIRRFASELSGSPELQSRLGTFKVWYAAPRLEGGHDLGPSKFVGYRGNTAAAHVENSGKHGMRHGNDAQDVLDVAFADVPAGSAEHRALWRELSHILSRYGRRPHKGTRFRMPVQRQLSEAVAQVSPSRTGDWIISDPSICSGRPTLKGTRIRVSDVLQLLAGGDSAEQIAADYPSLRLEHIEAALVFAAAAVEHRFIKAA
jgi:uncharacterized protein (DUF433 family)